MNLFDITVSKSEIATTSSSGHTTKAIFISSSRFPVIASGFSLVHCAVCVSCYWLRQLNCFAVNSGALKWKPLHTLIDVVDESNAGSFTHVFRTFRVSYMDICFNWRLWLVHWIVCLFKDWPEWLIWFWLYDTHSSTALLLNNKNLVRSW